MAEIESRRVQFDLDLARKNLDRAVQLAKTGVMAESALQKAGTDVEVLEAQADQMRAAIELRKAELSSIEAKLSQPTETADMRRTCCVNLTAPVDGVVLSVFAKSEQPIAVGAKIAEIGDPGIWKSRSISCHRMPCGWHPVPRLRSSTGVVTAPCRPPSGASNRLASPRFPRWGSKNRGSIWCWISMKATRALAMASGSMPA